MLFHNRSLKIVPYTENVAFFSDLLVFFHDPHQVVVTHFFAGKPTVSIEQVNQHTLSLDALNGHVLNTKCLSIRAVVLIQQHVFAGTKTVVINRLWLADAHHVEHGSAEGKDVPLRGVLVVKRNLVIGGLCKALHKMFYAKNIVMQSRRKIIADNQSVISLLYTTTLRNIINAEDLLTN